MSSTSSSTRRLFAVAAAVTALTSCGSGGASTSPSALTERDILDLLLKERGTATDMEVDDVEFALMAARFEESFGVDMPLTVFDVESFGEAACRAMSESALDLADLLDVVDVESAKVANPMSRGLTALMARQVAVDTVSFMCAGGG